MTRTVGVLGPGAVGAALAVPLALEGVRVVCVARPETAAAIAREGLTLVRQGEELHVRPEASDELREPVDVLLVTVKAPGLQDALRRVSAPAETVLSLLNGIEHMDVIRSRLQGNVVAGTIGLLEAYRESATRVIQTTPRLVITAAEHVSLPGVDVRVMPERALLWDKLARMAPFAAATALTQRPVGDLRNDPDWRPRLERAVEEACAVANADGVALAPEEEWKILETLPATLMSSTGRDIAAGRPSELDAITGAVVRAGRRLGVPTPALEAILEEACRAPSR